MIERRKKEGIPINKALKNIMKGLIKELNLGGFNFPF